MSSNITECELEQRLLAVAEERRHHFLQTLQQLDAALAATLQAMPADEWADYPPLAALPQLQPQLNALKQVDAALCQWQIGLYGLCSDCEAELTSEQLLQDPCRQRCDPCEQKYGKAQHVSWQL
ncbi:transcriptional regulator, TraR/DksA family protein [uncultured Oceanisphaera sp.]|uniref:transcriptional regulator, TraR/DksA family protein n=1 Tax=uncultured Oceanisphaera sp. TaxID=353858 RepID=UPI002609E022|nr:transcriptional regulator, TraR/DksA family protein [uncultured Oceanisphaera sp.]